MYFVNFKLLLGKINYYTLIMRDGIFLSSTNRLTFSLPVKYYLLYGHILISFSSFIYLIVPEPKISVMFSILSPLYNLTLYNRSLRYSVLRNSSNT